MSAPSSKPATSTVIAPIVPRPAAPMATGGAAPTRAAPAPVATSSAVAAVVMPEEKTVMTATKFCIQQDKQLAFDYYGDSISGKAFFGENIHTKEKNLFKNTEEFTSPIREVYRTGGDMIVITENTVYIVSGKTGKKPVE